MPWKDPEKRRAWSKDYNRRYREAHPPTDESRAYHAKKSAESRKRNKEYVNLRAAATGKGLDADMIIAAFAANGNVCESCGCTPDNGRVVIDHNHSTGEFRGFICHSCNIILGWLEKHTASGRVDAVTFYWESRR